MSEQPAQGRIVVGVDGSAPSEAALRWAVRQASLTDAAVEAVIAWHTPTMTGGYAWAPVSVLDAEDWGDVAAKVLADAIAEAVPEAAEQITPVVSEGNPAQVLITQSAGADLLVVGSRGHGGFAEALLGSVGQHCVHHAPCPVVIIRGQAASS